MLRQLTATILILTFAAQNFSGTVLMLDYYTNTAAFIKNCENKARPLMHCNGQCVLMKKIKEQEKKDQQNPERKGENKSDVYSSKSFFTTTSHNTETVRTQVNSFFQLYFPSTEQPDIFHPPAVK